jgi:GNAT superfamily N-acetyltransferase
MTSLRYPLRPEDIKLPPISAVVRNTPVAHVADADIYYLPNDGIDDLVAVMNGQIIALLKVFKQAVGGIDTILLTYVAPEYRNQGRMRLLLDFYVTNYGPVLSDDMHSPDAREMWSKLLMRPGRLRLSIYDPDTNTSRRVVYRNGDPVDDPWAEDHWRILAEARQISESSKRTMLASGRGFDGWYGRETEYNP